VSEVLYDRPRQQGDDKSTIVGGTDGARYVSLGGRTPSRGRAVVSSKHAARHAVSKIWERNPAEAIFDRLEKRSRIGCWPSSGG